MIVKDVEGDLLDQEVDEARSVELIKAELEHLDDEGEVTIVRFRRR